MLEFGVEAFQVIDVLSFEVRKELVEFGRNQTLHRSFEYEQPLNESPDIKLFRNFLD